MEQQSAYHRMLNGLNDQQRKAVTAGNGVFVVCAGAGSGKTRVITTRMIHLMLESHVSPHAIIALTFTNKAAREMKERVAAALPAGMGLPVLGTFHSYGVQLLKIYRNGKSLPDFTIMDDDDQSALITTIMKRFDINKRVTPKSVLALISRLKNGFDDEIFDPLVKHIFDAYEQEKKKSNCFDFDDLLLETLKLFKTDAEFRERFQRRIRHVLVDEYQDTNRVQHELLQEMTKNSAGTFVLDSLCVVGDEDQSIYSWRGAVVTNMLEFSKVFPQAELITIDQNYRSVQQILDVANGVIAYNVARNKKKLWSARPAKNRVRIFSCSSAYQEAELVCQAVATFMGTTRTTGTFAILYRSHYQSRSIEEAFIRNAISYQIIGGIRFYHRQEIKDILAYLRLIVNPYDRVAWRRAINTPLRGLGDAFVEKFLDEWDRSPLLDFIQMARVLLDQSTFAPRQKNTLEQFIALFSDMNSTMPAEDAVQQVIDRTAYLTYLADSGTREEVRARTENVKELLQSVRIRGERGVIRLDDFLQEVALLQEQPTHENADSVSVVMMTLHAAKGLEFDTVVITGVEEGIIPSTHAMYEHSLVEEERRLLYVGITRARERLMLTYARSRAVFGQVSDQRPSRFVAEMPQSEVMLCDVAQFPPYYLRQYLASWKTQAQ